MPGDMTYEELMAYKGVNPCPADMDAYWDKALRELEAVDPQVELIPADCVLKTVDCFDLWFTGVRGARIHCRYARPKESAGKIPAAVHFHGYADKSPDWYGLVGLAGQGIAVAAMDCRGQGGRSQDTSRVEGTTFSGHIIRGLDNPDPQDLLMRHIFLDTAELARIMMGLPEVDAENVYAFGGSQGGGLTLACASLEPRVKKICILYPFLSDYKRYWQMGSGAGYEELRTYFRHFDPRHEREDEVFTKLGYIDVKNLTKRIRGEVRMATGLSDCTVWPSTQFAAFNQITAPKQFTLYPDFGHEALPDYNDRMMEFFLGTEQR